MQGGIELINFLILGVLIFTIGVTGILINKKSIINILMSIELMLLGVNINFVAFSVNSHDLAGQVFTIMIMTVAAAEAAIGLAILVAYKRNRDSINIEDISHLRG